MKTKCLNSGGLQNGHNRSNLSVLKYAVLLQWIC